MGTVPTALRYGPGNHIIIFSFIHQTLGTHPCNINSKEIKNDFQYTPRTNITSSSDLGSLNELVNNLTSVH